MPFEAWLQELASAKQGGATAKLKPITRGAAYEQVVVLTGDFSADAFGGSIATKPDDGASKVADFTADPGTFDGTNTPITLTLTDVATAALTPDSDGDGLVWLIWELMHTPSGSTERRILGGIVAVSGRVGSV